MPHHPKATASSKNPLEQQFSQFLVTPFWIFLYIKLVPGEKKKQSPHPRQIKHTFLGFGRKAVQMSITTHLSCIIRNIFISRTDQISLQERERLAFCSLKENLIISFNQLVLVKVTGIPLLTIAWVLCLALVQSLYPVWDLCCI